MTDSFRMIKSEGRGTIIGATAVEGDGPLELYLASDDLTEAEISTVLGDAAGFPLARDDIGGSQVALRPVFYLTTVPFVPQVGAANGAKITFEWSKIIRWTFGDTAGFTLCVLNRGTSALTTGSVLGIQHTAFGLWVGA